MSDSDSTASPEPQRLIKIIVFSDYICSFCYIGNKSLRDAIEACSDLPVRFDVEFRPFMIMCPTSDGKPFKRNEYLAKKFGKEDAALKWKFVEGMAEKAGLKMSNDGIMCRPILAHRLAVKAYQVGGQEMQRKLNDTLFEACFANGEDITNLDFLSESAEKIGVMSREEAINFLDSTECGDCVEKMMEAAKANGVNGVPFIIIDGRWALNGMQPTDCYVQVFRKLAASAPSSSSSSPTACSACTGPLLEKKTVVS
ncbi:thioredoxin-like protein [Hygrophoropsis aurantiaca]|uniref:Thioredoxin-like protein n=1 Tax=Hygrophoropsis aurantiaca TaxID=72124 RepID=A0ACB8AII0_9AGAM|nr:thioredoxin-like protein [Hygrophoropsis aurantiaca]